MKKLGQLIGYNLKFKNKLNPEQEFKPSIHKMDELDYHTDIN